MCKFYLVFNSRFEIAAFVGKRQFPSVKCSNKKDGKTEACDLALRQLIAEGQFQPTSVVWITLDWLQSLKQFFINVPYHILVASLTLIASE